MRPFLFLVPSYSLNQRRSTPSAEYKKFTDT